VKNASKCYLRPFVECSAPASGPLDAPVASAPLGQLVAGNEAVRQASQRRSFGEGPLRAILDSARNLK
jgi:hypothetical protein